MSAKKENNVTVAVRIRPMNEKEVTAGMSVYFKPSSETDDVEELDEEGHCIKHWSYDHVFGETSTNQSIFESVGGKLVDAAVDGYNTVLFMYGQTSSGKTFTLFGDEKTAGLVQHSMEHLYKRVMDSTDTEFVIKLTYSELYNEELKDLLATTANPEPLKIIDDPNLGPLIQNITEANFSNPAEMKALLADGEKRRHFGVTNMNAHSSRSHVMVRLSIETRKVPTKPASPLRQSWGRERPHCVSTLNLVDLAGSERANKSGTSGQALVEGSFINKSLLTLGTVIANLSEGKTQHIPYRNSRLTRLLASALGGNAKTAMISCISPAQGNVMESLSTLRFASRAKRIVNLVQKNEIMSMKTLNQRLANQNAMIEQLRSQLEVSRQMGFSPDDSEQGGETIKDKAVLASKSWRNLRFVMANGPVIAQKLRGEGRAELAKKVQEDVKAALAGSKDLGIIIDEHMDLITTHLPKERKLMQKMQHLLEQNEADAIISEADLHKAMAASATGRGGGGANDEDNYLGIDADFDMAMGGGGEEQRERFEAAQLHSEEFRVVAILRIRQLESEVAGAAEREKALKHQVELLSHQALQKDEEILRRTTSEGNLQTQLEDLRSKSAADLEAANKKEQQLMSKIGELEVQIGDVESVLTNKNHEHLAKEADIDKLRAQCDQLTSDLSASAASRKALEEEMARTRADMRVQMDRLRNNMHEMLVQGGQEAKVMESHNEQLQQEVDKMRDSLEIESKTKVRLEAEVSHVRADLTLIREDHRSQMEAVTVSRAENAELSQKLRDARLEITRLTSVLTVLEQNHQKTQQQLSEVSSRAEEAAAALQAEMKTKSDRAAAKQHSLEEELQAKVLEAASLKKQLDLKTSLAARLEQTYATDVARLEKKLAYQGKLHEEMTTEIASASAQAQTQHQRYLEESKALREKISELEGIVNSVNRYLEQQSDLVRHRGGGSGDGGSDGGDGGSGGGRGEDDYLNDADADDYGDDDGGGYGGYGGYAGDGWGASEQDEEFEQSSRARDLRDPAPASSRRVAASMSAELRRSFYSLNPTAEEAQAVMGGGGDRRDSFDFQSVDDIDIDDDDEDASNATGGGAESAGGSSRGEAESGAEQKDSGAGPASARSRGVAFDLDGDGSSGGGGGGGGSRSSSPQQHGSASGGGGGNSGRVGRTSSSLSAGGADGGHVGSSEHFRRIMHGMRLVTVSLEHTMREEKIYREFLMQQEFQNLVTMDSQRTTIRQLMDRQEFLEETGSSLQSSLSFAREKEATRDERIVNSEADMQQLKAQYLESVKAEKQAVAKANTLEQLYLDQKVHVEKLRMEIKQHTDAYTDLHMSHIRLMEKVNEAEEEISVLRSRLELSDQELGVLRVERDEMMQRFLRPSHFASPVTSPHAQMHTGTHKHGAGAWSSGGASGGAVGGAGSGGRGTAGERSSSGGKGGAVNYVAAVEGGGGGTGTAGTSPAAPRGLWLSSSSPSRFSSSHRGGGGDGGSGSVRGSVRGSSSERPYSAEGSRGDSTPYEHQHRGSDGTTRDEADACGGLYGSSGGGSSRVWGDSQYGHGMDSGPRSGRGSVTFSPTSPDFASARGSPAPAPSSSAFAFATSPTTPGSAAHSFGNMGSGSAGRAGGSGDASYSAPTTTSSAAGLHGYSGGTSSYFKGSSGLGGSGSGGGGGGIPGRLTRQTSGGSVGSLGSAPAPSSTGFGTDRYAPQDLYEQQHHHHHPQQHQQNQHNQQQQPFSPLSYRSMNSNAPVATGGGGGGGGGGGPERGWGQQ